MSLYLHVEAPGDMFHNISRAALRQREFVIRAALWETVFWSCTNCNFVYPPFKRVRLVDSEMGFKAKVVKTRRSA